MIIKRSAQALALMVWGRDGGGVNGKPRDNDILHLAVTQSPAVLTGLSVRLDWLEHQLVTADFLSLKR